MLKTGDEYRASALERNRRHTVKLALMDTKPANQIRMVQFIITIRLPVVNIRRIS